MEIAVPLYRVDTSDIVAGDDVGQSDRHKVFMSRSNCYSISVERRKDLLVIDCDDKPIKVVFNCTFRNLMAVAIKDDSQA